MTYAAHPSLLSRFGALSCSALVHAAIGIVLFINFPIGAPKAGTGAGDHGHVLVVELLPLPEGGASARGEDQQERPQSNDHGLVQNAGGNKGPEKRANLDTFGTPPPGDGGSGEGVGHEAMTDSQTGAPTLAGAEVQAFRARLLHHIEQFRRYPPDARKAGQEGVARVHFVMNRSGDVLDAWIELSSGSALLDEEAVAAVMRAQPLPAPPADWPGSFAVSIPIGYSLK